MQFGGVRSTSQVANSFIGTGRVAGAVIFVRSAIFGPGGPRDTRNAYVSPRLAAPVRRWLSTTVGVKIATRQRDGAQDSTPTPPTGGFADSGLDRSATLPVRNQSELSRWIAEESLRYVPRHLVGSIWDDASYDSKLSMLPCIIKKMREDHDVISKFGKADSTHICISGKYVSSKRIGN